MVRIVPLVEGSVVSEVTAVYYFSWSFNNLGGYSVRPERGRE